MTGDTVTLKHPWVLIRNLITNERGDTISLQPENIVLKESGAEQLKIIDFGTAQDLSINPQPKVMVGTPEFIGTDNIRLSPIIS